MSFGDWARRVVSGDPECKIHGRPRPCHRCAQGAVPTERQQRTTPVRGNTRASAGGKRIDRERGGQTSGTRPAPIRNVRKR
jgi:hypothetical protein